MMSRYMILEWFSESSLKDILKYLKIRISQMYLTFVSKTVTLSSKQ